MIQEDGGKKIELKPGFLMEHDKDVKFFLSCLLFLCSGLLYLGLLQIETCGTYVLRMPSLIFLRFFFQIFYHDKEVSHFWIRWGLLWLDLIVTSITTKSSKFSIFHPQDPLETTIVY